MTILQQTCLHESAHAVCALLLGKPYGCRIYAPGIGRAGAGELVESAIEEDYTDIGKLSRSFSQSPLREIMDYATIYAAGFVTVAIVRHGASTKPEFPAYGDRTMISASCWAAFPDACDFHVENAFTDLACARARRLLGPVLRQVMAVAGALLAKKLLSADEVKQIFDSTQKGTNENADQTNQGA